MQCSIAGPLIIGNLLSFCLLLTSTAFVGHVGELELSGASIASSFTVVTGFSVVLGMGFTLETLCGQAYGAGQYKKLGIYMQRAIFVLNLTAILVAFVWANIETILNALGQDPEIASIAGGYGVLLIPTIFASATSQPFVKFLQAQSLVAPILCIAMVTLVCHLPLCWFMVSKSGMGYQGAAVATSISYWVNAVLLGLYVSFSRTCVRCRASLSWEALHDLKNFFKLAIPSAAMICLEWWSYEVLVILSGLLDNPELQASTISICISTESLIFMFPLGLSAAASTRVSNALGAGHALVARAAVSVALVLALTEALIIASILLLVRNIWGQFYSSEEEVVKTVASLLPFLAVSTTFDGLQAVLSGVVRGAGWQKTGTVVNLASFYVLGLPIGCLLAFVANFEGKGLLIGLICGAFSQFVAFVAITQITDWEKEAKKAADRLGLNAYTTEPLLITQN